MKRAIPKPISQAWTDLRRAPALEALAACRRLQEELNRWEGVVANEARLEAASWDEIGKALGISRQSAWERYRRRRSSAVLKPGEIAVELDDGEQVLTSQELLEPLAAGIQLSEEFLPWAQVRKVLRYLRPDEPHEVELSLTLYGMELRTPTSLALYPRPEDVPESFQQATKALLRAGEKRPATVFDREGRVRRGAKR
ncbi:MAG: hypothetical protein ACRDK3_03410 [Actinomycetota bacterium]